MGRLIDAAVLLDKNAEQCGEKSCDTCRFIGKERCASYMAIVETPTAYNVEAVIQQLKENSFSDFEEKYVDNGEAILYLADALEIVRKGGVK